MTEYETKDTGNHSTYASGMKRDSQEGKARFDLLMPLGVPYEEQLLTRWANLMERACRSKYPERNWEQANSTDEMARMKSSAFRHFMQWYCGVEDGEDHAAGFMFNVLAFETTRYKVERDNPNRMHYGIEMVHDTPAQKLDRLMAEQPIFSAANLDDFGKRFSA